MRFTIPGLAAVACTVTTLAAQPTFAQAFDGAWTVSYSSGSGNEREADVKITGTQGTWQVRARPGKDKKDPCVGRPFPLTVTESTAESLAFRVDASATVSGCDDRNGSVKVVDAKTLEGQFNNGRPVKFVRP